MEKEVRDFGSALKALKDGYKVAREGWNGKGMFLILANPDKTTEPQNVKLGFIYTTGIKTLGTADIKVSPFITMKTADNCLVPWLASQTDLLAEDWTIVE